MKNLLFIVGLLFPFFLAGQSINGKVTNDKNEPLMGASVYWHNSTIGVSTDVNGEFEIPENNKNSRKLVASFIGYAADTIEIVSGTSITFILSSSEVLGEIVVKGRQDGIRISSLNPIKTEQITQAELGRAACCDLAGCFGTQSSVQPHTTNLITNSKELRILGLSGVYNQVLIDGFPMIQGLSYTYGISSIPGTSIANIYVAKGANSVLQGYESISGQINVETKDPDNTDKILLNAYVNSFAEKHLNANIAFKSGDWSNLSTFNMVQPANRIDKDEDNFLDLPLLTRYAISNKWKYRSETEWGWHSKIGIRYLNETRLGGQMDYTGDNDKGSSEVYGQFVKLNQPEFWTKTGYRLNDIHHFVVFASAFHQDQNSYFGTLNYKANQSNFYANIQYELNYSDHVLKTGISVKHLDLNEKVSFSQTSTLRSFDGKYHRSETVPGIFAENIMKFMDGKLTWIAGIRTDRHNEFGSFVTPRTLLKYNISPQSIIRANIGTGWRTANVFSENINLLASSRDIIFEEDLEPEEAINYGVNFSQKFESYNVAGYISADYYHTDFQNQIFPDYDADPTKAFIRNYNGTSIGNGFQLELFFRIHEQIEIKTGYNYLEVYREMGETKQLLPFNSKHKILTTFSYRPISNKYHFDVNAHWFGKQRLPDTDSNPIEFQRPGFSNPYTVVNAQFTYNVKMTELYLGCENIFNFRQNQPIINWQNPFDAYFDTSSVWGPTRGREVYIGARYYWRDNAE